jgi:hypothetical protein
MAFRPKDKMVIPYLLGEIGMPSLNGTLEGSAMRKLLSITDSEEFWKVFSEEREVRRNRLRNLPFAKKIEIVEKMQAAQLKEEKR